jgi:hypothetical protein
MTAELITAWATIILAIVSIASTWIAYSGIRSQTEEGRRSAKSFRLSLSVDLALKLEERFNTERFCQIRSAAARALLEGRDLVGAEEVFDFFDTVGEMVKQGALSEEIVHSLFFHWINLYWNAASSYIAREQEGTALVWQEFEKVYRRVLQIEKRKDPNSKDINPGIEHIREQLNDELQCKS